MPVPPQAITAVAGGIDPVREAAYDDWWAHVAFAIRPQADPEAVAHEAFCAGWEAAAPHLAERERNEGDVALAIHRSWCDKQGCDEVCEGDRDGAATFLKVASLLRQGGEEPS